MYVRTKIAYPMDDAEIRKFAPSVFATEPAARASSRYRFEPTINVVNSLRDEGFEVIGATQKRSKNQLTTKHLVILRHRSSRELVPGIMPEVLLTNSHDTGCARKAELGLFRAACTNGLVVNEESMGAVRLTHANHSDDFIEGVFTLLSRVIEISPMIETMSATYLPSATQAEYAQRALTLRWKESCPLAPHVILNYRRAEDRSNDLWTSYNRMQEVLIKGNNSKVTGKGFTRPLTSLDVISDVNRKLWSLTKEYIH